MDADWRGADGPRRAFLMAMAAGAVAAPGLAMGWQPGSHEHGPAETGGDAGDGAVATYFEWSEVRPGVWVAIGGGGNSLAYAAADGDRKRGLVIDTKLGGLGHILAGEAEEKMGEPVWGAMNTHHHFDHVGGNTRFTPARVVAHEGAAARIVAQHRRLRTRVFDGTDEILADASLPERVRAWARAERKSMDLADAEDFVPTHTAGGGWGDRVPVIVGVPVSLKIFGAGHTDTDVVVVLEDENVVHVGDLVFNGLNPFVDPEGGATIRGWIGSLERCKVLCDAETVVVPGHGPVGDRRLLDVQMEYLRALIAAAEAEVDAGVPVEESVEKEWGFMEGLGFEQFKQRAIAAACFEVRREREEIGAGAG